MKKHFLTLLTAILILTSCASKDVASGSKATEVTSEVVETVNATEEKIEAETRGDSLSLTEDEYNYLSEKIKLDSYADECAKALGSIGFSTISDMSLESARIDSDGMIVEDVIFADSNGKKVKLSCMYIPFSDKWGVISIGSTTSEKLYWMPEKSKKYYDLYDYKTDELISAKSEDYDSDKFREEIEEEMDKSSEEFDKALDDIAAKYGVNSRKN